MPENISTQSSKLLKLPLLKMPHAFNFSTHTLVIIIEHGLDAIKNADYIIGMGPGGGESGGRSAVSGTLDDFKRAPESATVKFVSQC